MKLSGFRKGLSLRWRLFWMNAVYGFKESHAYSINNWGNMVSMVVYMVTYLVFLSVLFGRIDSIAGYSYSEMMFFTLVMQINYYLLFGLTQINVEMLTGGVNTGELDLWLVKPVPSLWFVTFRKLNLGEILYGALPASIPLFLVLMQEIDKLDISWRGALMGSACLLMGQVILNCFMFGIGMISFFTGEGKNARNLGLELLMFGDGIPYEGYPRFLKVLGVSLVPFLVQSTLATSFFLGKNGNGWLLLYIFGLMIVFLILKNALWSFALKRYSSASS